MSLTTIRWKKGRLVEENPERLRISIIPSRLQCTEQDRTAALNFGEVRLQASRPVWHLPVLKLLGSEMPKIHVVRISFCCFNPLSSSVWIWVLLKHDPTIGVPPGPAKPWGFYKGCARRVWKERGVENARSHGWRKFQMFGIWPLGHFSWTSHHGKWTAL